jgi:DNA mismatch repair ATPase MutS
MGKRSFSHTFLNPTTDIKYLQKEYDITEHLLINPYPEMKNYLSGIKDISKMSRQIMLKKISPKSLFYLFQNL